MLPEALLGKNYFVCHFCKEGAVDSDEDFVGQHIIHERTDLITGQQFLTQYLAEGYIDHNNPNLQPICVRLGEKDENTPVPKTLYGMPQSTQELLKMHRNMRKTTTNLPQNRPLLANTKEETKTQEQKFIKYVAIWHRKIDTGIGFNQIVFKYDKYANTCVSFLKEGKYEIQYDSYNELTDRELNKEACECIIRIAGSQRFGEGPKEDWLIEQLANLLIG